MGQFGGDQFRVALFKILGGSAAVQRLMWADGVVEALPIEKLTVERDDLQLAVIEFVELLGVGALCPLDVGV